MKQDKKIREDGKGMQVTYLSWEAVSRQQHQRQQAKEQQTGGRRCNWGLAPCLQKADTNRKIAIVRVAVSNDHGGSAVSLLLPT